MKIEFRGARAFAMDALHHNHPELMRVTEVATTHLMAARNLNAQLSVEFRGVRFKMSTSQLGEGGRCLWVQWTDGPTVDQVRQYGSLYSERSFGERKPEEAFVTAWREAFGSVETVVTERLYSDDAINRAIRGLEMPLGQGFVALNATVDKCRDGSMFARRVVIQGMGEVNAMDLVERVLDHNVWLGTA